MKSSRFLVSVALALLFFVLIFPTTAGKLWRGLELALFGGTASEPGQLAAVLVIGNGATYYIDYSSGSDNNSGTSQSSPWQHSPGDPRATGNANITLRPGDTVLFKGGVIYQFSAGIDDRISANASGTLTNPIVYRSGHLQGYGTGRAKIDASNVDFRDYDNGALNLGGYSHIQVEGLEMFNAPWSNYSGLIGWMHNSALGAGGDIVINDVVLHGNFKDNTWTGITIKGAWEGALPTNFTVKNSQIFDTGTHGILWWAGIDGITITNNKIYRTGPDPTPNALPQGDGLFFYGITDVARPKNIYIANNEMYDFPSKGNMIFHGDSGAENVIIEKNYLHLETVKEDNFGIAIAEGKNYVIRDNVLVFNTHFSGLFRLIPITTIGLKDISIYRNTLVGYSSDGGSLFGTEPAGNISNLNFKNNVIYVTDQSHNYVSLVSNVDGKIDGLAMDYNFYFHGDAMPFTWFGSEKTFAEWKVVSAQDAHSKEQNPMFVDINNPKGPDGIMWTNDDGLKPAPGSPACSGGEGGTYVGAYSCGNTTDPTNGLCATALNTCLAGTLTDTADSSTNYLWNCNGLNGGTTASCSLPKSSGGDTSAPSVSLTAPAANSSVSSTVSVSANASDNVGVVGVQFKVDGVNLGAEDTVEPYSVSWNTTSTSNGSHTLTAVAKDAAGNSAIAGTVTATVSNGNTGNGATYYIDYSSGSNNNSGTSQSSPWKHAPGDTRATGNANIIPKPGDTVLFKGGVIYQFDPNVNDRISALSSGTISQPIYYKSGHLQGYGTGRAKIDATNVDFVNYENGALNLAGYSNIRVEGLEMFNSPYVDYTGLISWQFNSGLVPAGQGYAGNIYIDNVELYGDFNGKTNMGVYIAGSWDGVSKGAPTAKNITVTNSNIHDTSGHGMLWRYDIDGITITNNKIYRNGPGTGPSVGWHHLYEADGMFFSGEGATYAQKPRNIYIAYNEMYDFPSKGPIILHGAHGTENVVIEKNYFHYTKSFLHPQCTTGVASVAENCFGLSISEGDNFTIRNNVIAFDATIIGVIGLLSESEFPIKGASIYNNTIVGYVPYGSYGIVGSLSLFEGNKYAADYIKDITSKNNIYYTAPVANGVYTSVRAGSGGFVDGFKSDYNLYFNGPTEPFRWYDTITNFTNWKSLSGQDTHSKEQNPMFVDINNPKGPDGVMWTNDDGLKPAPGSPACSGGEGGTYIGAYSCGNTTDPTNGLCSTTLNSCQAGTFSDVTDSSTNYLWNCNGINGGTNASCSLPKGGDTIDPTVSLTAPTNNSTVSGTVTVSASASDNVGVAGVQFKVDGANLGAEDTVEPYSVYWNTTATSNGNHTLTAVARDAAGNSATSNAVIASVNNGLLNTGAVTAFFKFDETSGQELVDTNRITSGLLGASNEVENSDPSRESGSVNNGLAFDGNDDFATIAPVSSLSSLNSFSYSAWIYPTGWGGVSFGRIISKESNVGFDDSYLYLDGPGATLGMSMGNNSAYSLASYNSISLDEWQHVVVTYDNASDRMPHLYINGKEATYQNQRAMVGVWDTNSGPFVLGNRVSKDRGFRGLIDEVKIFNHSLTPAEVGQLYGNLGPVNGQCGSALNICVAGTWNDAPDSLTRYFWNCNGLNGGTTASCSLAKPPGGDTSSPSVSLTAPAINSNVSGTVTVSASASDNVGVAGVQFKLDGANLGAEDTSAPYSIFWNTAGVSNGSHTLTAAGRDAAGNIGTSGSVAVTTSNSVASPLSAYLKFDEASGQALVDTNGITSGFLGLSSAAESSDPVRTGGRVLEGLLFNGTNDLLTVAPSSPLNDLTSFTYSAWIYPTGWGGSGFARIVSKESSAGFDGHYLYLDGPAAALGVSLGEGSSDSLSSLNSVKLNTWQHVVMSYNDSSDRAPHLYIDGKEVAYRSQKVTSGMLATNSRPFILGNRPSGDRSFRGIIDEVRIYNRALTSAEVAQLYAEDTPQRVSCAKSPVAYLTLSENSGQTLVDANQNPTGFLGLTSAVENSDPSRVGRRVKKGLQFNGGDDSATITSSLALNDLTSFTYSAWIYPTGWGGSKFGRILSRESSAGFDGIYFFLDGPGATLGANMGSSGSDSVANFNLLALNNWQQVAVTYDASGDRTPHLYIDGKEVIYSTQLPSPGALIKSSRPVILGNRPALDRGFEGTLDEIKVFDCPLTGAEIQELYNLDTTETPLIQ